MDKEQPKVIDVEFVEDQKKPESVMDQVADFLSGVADVVEENVPTEDGKEIADEVRRCSSAVVSAKDGAHKLKDAYDKVSKTMGKLNNLRGSPLIHRKF